MYNSSLTLHKSLQWLRNLRDIISRMKFTFLRHAYLLNRIKLHKQYLYMYKTSLTSMQRFVKQ